MTLRLFARFVALGAVTALIIAIAMLVLPRRAGAQVAPVASTYGLLYTVGADTIAVERITSNNGAWSGELRLRAGARITWTLVEVSPGVPGPVAISAFQTERDTTPAQRVVFRNTGDSITMQVQIPFPSQQVFPSRAGAFVLLNNSLGMVAFALGRVPRDSFAEFPVFLTTGGRTFDANASWQGDTATVVIAGQASHYVFDRGGKLVSVSVPLQRLRATRIEAPALADLRMGAPSYDAPAGAPYTATDVTIQSPAGHVLAGTFTRPRTGPARVPVVVTISGSGPQDRDETIATAGGYRAFRQIADTLGRNGIAVLRYDDRGFGKSTGSFSDATTEDFAHDVRTVLAWLRARADVDTTRIYLLGHSEGGIIAPLVAAADTSIAGLVLLAAPSENLRTVIEYQQRFRIDRDTSLHTPGARDSAFARARAQTDSTADVNQWLRFLLSYEPLVIARRLRSPSLVLQGETDRQVTANQAEVLGAALRTNGGDVTVRVFPQLNHLFIRDPDGDPANYGRLANGRIESEVLATIVNWLKAH